MAITRDTVLEQMQDLERQRQEHQAALEGVERQRLEHQTILHKIEGMRDLCVHWLEKLNSQPEPTANVGTEAPPDGAPAAEATPKVRRKRKPKATPPASQEP